ncbi:O-methyl transferase B [Lophiostoma macrostomum CBS 122681]|uniref:O-methyl transferase B n=1 Tax=Lophiostoma macrostomum CBS 122681 TaxID=1314788 RepID=A0A6A6T1D0_9PLEO|nr:O-methyl transferase B [Lophiostoma macrostomum CBS 122681]
MDVLLDQVKQLATTLSEATRRQFLNSLNHLVLSLETPNDTVYRYGHMNLQTAAIRIGFDLGLFCLLSEASGPVTAEELSQKSGSELQLTHRILRYLAAIGAVGETSANQYSANNVTRNLTEKLVEAGLSHYLYTIGPEYAALPDFLKETKYRNPVDELHTAFQYAWKTSLPTFRWFSENPEHLAYFNEYMALRRAPTLSWLSVYPVDRELKNSDAENSSEAIYVNIGGGIGHQCKQFREKFPDVKGRVILQDLPHSIAKALHTPGVENMEHDFFQPQPIKDAKFYFMRGVLHDHPPAQARRILERTKAAMGPQSVLLIDEMILPESGVNLQAASIDMTMMAVLAGLERTEAQWREFLGDVGLELAETFLYDPVKYEGVMHVKLA